MGLSLRTVGGERREMGGTSQRAENVNGCQVLADLTNPEIP